MGVEIVGNEYYQVLIDSTTMTAIGSVFDADEDVLEFLSWLKCDVRLLDDETLRKKVWRWRKELHENEYD